MCPFRPNKMMNLRKDTLKMTEESCSNSPGGGEVMVNAVVDDEMVTQVYPG